MAKKKAKATKAKLNQNQRQKKRRQPTPPAIATAATNTPDPFDLNTLRLPQDYNAVGVTKVLRSMQVRKPGKQEFIRVHPDPAYRGNVALLELKEARESYLVSGHALVAALATEVTHVTLYTAVTRQGTLFFWPVKLPGPDGREMDWHITQRIAAEEAMHCWLRLTANMEARAYDTFLAESVTAEPAWQPDYTFKKLLEVAFRTRLITSLDHPVVKSLQNPT